MTYKRNMAGIHNILDQRFPPIRQVSGIRSSGRYHSVQHRFWLFPLIFQSTQTIFFPGPKEENIVDDAGGIAGGVALGGGHQFLLHLVRHLRDPNAVAVRVESPPVVTTFQYRRRGALVVVARRAGCCCGCCYPPLGQWR